MSKRNRLICFSCDKNHLYVQWKDNSSLYLPSKLRIALFIELLLSSLHPGGARLYFESQPGRVVLSWAVEEAGTAKSEGGDPGWSTLRDSEVCESQQVFWRWPSTEGLETPEPWGGFLFSGALRSFCLWSSEDFSLSLQVSSCSFLPATCWSFDLRFCSVSFVFN